MAGGLLNIISVGNANVILTGNPTKTFFKATYSKYTNFGLQKFRLDFEGNRDLRLTEDSVFSFKIKRYAELLMDTYIVITLPDIWSPIYHPTEENNYLWSTYDFRWIRHIGTHIIRQVEITCGSLLLQKYSGEYIAAMVERDFNESKKKLYDRMTGNIDELNDPAISNGRGNTYPSAYFTETSTGSEPSIRSRTLYIPINAWFMMDSRFSFPLVALQYNELVVNITLRPIQELFQVRDVLDPANSFPYVQPDFNKEYFQMYRFLQSPPAIRITPDSYENKTKIWNADVHLVATYCFLSKDEAQLFAAEDQVYLVKDVFQYRFENVTGSKKVELTSSGMISNWMYTNWPYVMLPVNVSIAPADLPANINDGIIDPSMALVSGPRFQLSGINTGIFITGDFAIDNRRDILETMGVLLDGDYRENVMSRGIYDYIEKYVRTDGNAKDGLYCYNFCLNTSPYNYQPSGAINLSRFRTVELEFTTFVPQIDISNSNFEVICNDTGVPIAVSTKPGWSMYQYNYNLTVFEERYNVLSFISGSAGMLYSR
jgi:hypothetical protein